jgi:hypothetical protein
VSHAAALFVGMAAGIGVALVMTLWIAWSMRNGRRRASRRLRGALLLATLVLPIVVAIAMPDFKTALIAWLGYAIGFAISQLLTLPLSQVLVRRIERR